MFYPSSFFQPAPDNARDVYIEVAPGVRLHARIHDVADAIANVIAFHGNGEVVSHYDTQAATWASIGASLAVIDYRGYGRSTGTPTIASMLADAAPAFAGVVDLMPRRPTFAFGRSLGTGPLGEVAGLLAADLAGVIVDSGFARLAPGLAPIERLAVCGAPLLVLHGAEDTLLPPDGAREIVQRSPALDKRLVLLAGRGHNNIAGAREYWQALAAFLASAT